MASSSGTEANAVNTQRFKELKPTCVELLGQTSETSISQPSLPKLLRKLNSILASFSARQDVDASYRIARDAHIPLTPSLIHYVFFPLAQILRAKPRGAVDLPDVVREEVFRCLTYLAQGWWHTWTQEADLATTGQPIEERWKVWEQLLMLGAVALGGPPERQSKDQSPAPPPPSDESRLAIVQFMLALLVPRLSKEAPQAAAKPAPPPAKEWEWDGESELPSLDDYEEEPRAGPSTAPAPPPARVDAASQVYPERGHVSHTYQSSSCRGALAHALTAALDVASEAPPTHATSLKLRSSAISLARAVLVTWLAGQPRTLNRALLHDAPDEEVAQKASLFLPGVVSSLVRVALGRPRDAEARAAAPSAVPGELVGTALEMLAEALSLCLNDAATVSLRAAAKDGQAEKPLAEVSDLEQLVARAKITEEGEAEPATGEEPTKEASADSSAHSQLDSTITRVHLALFALTPLVQHQAASAQLGVATLASTLLDTSHETLAWRSVERLGGDGVDFDADEEAMPDTLRLMLRWLLDLAASPTAPTSVNELAAGAIHRALSHARVLPALEAELSWSLRALPRAVLAHRDERAAVTAHRLGMIFNVAVASPTIQTRLSSLLGPEGGVERWGSALLECLELADGSAKQASNATRPTRMPLRHLDALASSAVLNMLDQLGQAAARLALAQPEAASSMSHIVRFFLREGAKSRTSRAPASELLSLSRRRSASALLIADELLRGIATVLDDTQMSLAAGREGRRARKAAHRLAREVAGLVVETWDADQDEAGVSSDSQEQEQQQQAETAVASHTSEGTSAIEELRGLQGTSAAAEIPKGFGPALNLSFVGASSITSGNSGGVVSAPVSLALSTQRAELQLRQGDALLLSLLGSCSVLLGTSFRPLLLHTLYPLICGLASPHVVVRDAASEAMQRVAHASAYASVEGCVLDHADYVLGAASHRLVSGLGPELERLTRAQEAAHVQAQPSSSALVESSSALAKRPQVAVLSPLASAQTAPLVLVEVLRMLGAEALPLVEDAVDEVLEALDRFHGYEELADGLLGVLDRLVEVMAEDIKASGTAPPALTEGARAAGLPKPEEDMAAFEAWFKRRKAETVEEPPVFDPTPADNPDIAPPSMEPDDDQAGAPNRTQVVVASILAKCVPFLSHGSARLRARTLRLLRRGVEILASQRREAEVMPAINRAWPLVLARLGRSSTSPLPRMRRGASIDEVRANLTEREPHVWAEATALVRVLAEQLPDFVGRKIVDDVWPRLDALLRIAAATQELHAKAPGERGAPVSFLLDDAPSSKAVRQSSASGAALRSFEEHSLPWLLITNACPALATLVRRMGASVPEDTAWSIARQPQLLASLDTRQPSSLQQSAKSLYEALYQRNPDAVWAVLEGAAGSSTLPGFLHTPSLDLAASRDAILCGGGT